MNQRALKHENRTAASMPVRSQLTVAGADIRVTAAGDGGLIVEVERAGAILLSWTAPPVEQSKAAGSPPMAPAPVPIVRPAADRGDEASPAPAEPAPSIGNGGQLLRAEEVAERLRLSPTTVYRMARRGEIPSAIIGFSRRFPPEAVDAWLKRQQREAVTAGEGSP